MNKAMYVRKLFSLFLAGACALTTACANERTNAQDGGIGGQQAQGDARPGSIFREVTDVIPFERRARRKWDNPVIADLDGDGRQDLIITEHGHRIQVFWNNGATFSAPQDIAIGDLHGQAVTDLGSDGHMDLIIAQGGGGGNNPRRPVWFQFDSDRSMEKGPSLDYFEPGRGRAMRFIDTNGDGELELFLTGFPLPDQTKGANHLYRQADGANFEFVDHLPQAKWLGYRSAITDFNGDNDPDILLFGGKDVIALQGAAGSSFVDATAATLGGLTNTSDISSITEIDFDNDGDADLFVTRSEAQFDEETYYDQAARRFAFLVFRQDFLFDDIEVEGSLNIENLQMTYPHFDVFLGAAKAPVDFGDEQHGGRSLTVTPEEARGWPAGPVKAGLYIGHLGDGKWRVGGQVHSRLAAVINGVVSAPVGEPQVELPAKLLENRDGTYVDVAQQLGLEISEQTTSAATADFDNDGWSDLVVIRYGTMAAPNQHFLFRNRSGKRFERVANAGIGSALVGTTGGHVEAFDYDRDGAMDLVFSNERGRWHLMKNQWSSLAPQHVATIVAGPSPRERATPLGARLHISACGQNYVRQVGATSAGFSHGMNTHLHVGLGACQRVDSAQMRWTNGETANVQPQVFTTQ